MEPINWPAVGLAAVLAVAIGLVWHGPLFRTAKPILAGRSADGSPQPRRWLLVFAVFLIASAMLGHNYARIGIATLSAKPWLYFMQAGGLAAAFVIPALWLTQSRSGVTLRDRLVDAGFWLTAYLAMGAVFWALGQVAGVQ